MPLSQDLETYLKSAPFDKSVCQIIGPQLEAQPALFFVLSSASETGRQPAKERISSELIRQLAQDIGLQEIFIEDLNGQAAAEGDPIDPAEADRLLAEGQLTGVQHARLVAEQRLNLVSLAEPQDYQNYAKVLTTWMTGKERTEKALAVVNGALKRTITLSNKTIQAVLIRGEAYRGGRMLLSEYVRNLAQEAETVGLSLQPFPAVATFHELALKEQTIDVTQAKLEIERFSDKLLQALGEKEVWLRKTIEALSSAQPGEMKELEEQLQFLADYLNNSFTMRKLRESLFYRIALYGAFAEGFTELEKPREMSSRNRREKAFFSGVLQGPTHILLLLTKQLLAADTRPDIVVPEKYDFILDVGMFTGFDEADMPHLIQYVQYGNRYKSLVTSQLLSEIELLETQLLERASKSDQDRAVVGLHTTFVALRKRVLLHMAWGDVTRQFTQESPQANLALKLKQFPLLQQALKKEAFVVLDALHAAESLSREYYQRLDHRAQIIAAKLRAELSARSVDRAVVYVSEYSCKALLSNVKQVAPNSSYVVLVPFLGADRRQDADFSKFHITLPKPAESGADIAFYRKYDQDLAKVAKKHCDSPFCRFSGPAISDRIVCLTQPGSLAVFYCETCNKHYCGLELKQVEMSEQEIERWLEFNPLELIGPVGGKTIFSLQCRHCGNLVGKGKKTVVWNIDK